MARTRTIRPSFWTSFSLGRVGRDARLLFIGLWSEADDEGRLIDSPKGLAGALFPHDEDVTAREVEDWLAQLEQVGAILRYEAAGGRYIAVPKWSEYQKPPKPTPSRLPPPLVSSGNSRDSSESPLETTTGFRVLGLGIDTSSSITVSDARGPSTGNDDDDEKSQILAGALDLVAHHRIQATRTPITNRRAYAASVRQSVADELGPRARDILAASPHLTADRLAAQLEQAPSSPYAALEERQQRRREGTTCPVCDDRGVVETEAGFVDCECKTVAV